MLRSIAVGLVSTLVGMGSIALAQRRPADLECRTTETQAECFARLKCKANEELEDCQKRLTAERAKQGSAGQANGSGSKDGGREPDRDDRERRERRERESSDRDRGDRGDRDAGPSSRRQGQDDSDRRRGQRRSASGFQANKTFGLGFELGEPTGLNGKYFLSKSSALDFGIGWIYSHYYYGDGAHVYADYLWHPTSLVSAPAFELPVYIGVGLRFWDFHYCVQRVCDYGGSAVGIRVPIGIAFDFNRVPLDIFIQLVPVLDFVNGDYFDRYRNREHFGIDLSAGLRFWFK